MNFLLHLVKLGRIQPTDLISILEAHHGQRPRFGRIAISMGMLTESEVEQILRQQAREGNLFGETAAGIGLLSFTEVLKVLAVQARDTPSLTRLIVEKGLMSRDELDEEHARFTESHESALGSNQPAESEDPVAKP